jgi:ribosomal protein S18 acetylase RimI-like enzyme
MSTDPAPIDRPGQTLRLRDATPRDAKALGDVFVQAWRREHAGLLPQEVLSARSAAQSAANWSRTLTAIARGERTNQFVLVALLPGSSRVGLIVGVEQAAERPAGEGEVILVQVADGHRGHGVGAALMSAAARRLINGGARSMIVRVLEANGSARRFYERLGGELTTETRQVEESGLWFPECVYLWPDLSAVSPA